MSLMSFTLTVQNSFETAFANCVYITTFKYFPLLQKEKKITSLVGRRNRINIEIKYLATVTVLCLSLVQNKILSLLWYQTDIYIPGFFSGSHISSTMSPVFKLSCTISYVPVILYAGISACTYTFYRAHVHIRSLKHWTGSWVEIITCNTNDAQFWASAFEFSNFVLKQRLLMIVLIAWKKVYYFSAWYIGLWAE